MVAAVGEVAVAGAVVDLVVAVEATATLVWAVEAEVATAAAAVAAAAVGAMAEAVEATVVAPARSAAVIPTLLKEVATLGGNLTASSSANPWLAVLNLCPYANMPFLSCLA